MTNNLDHPIYDVAIATPLQIANKLSRELGFEVYLKREDLQPVHSFKIRGAYNKIISLSEKQKAAGVIASSAGNHAQGVALAAKKLKLKAIIVMPTTTPKIKIDAVKAYGAKVILEGDSYSDCYQLAMEICKETSMTFVHPFDDEKVIEGQGTVATEILNDLSGVTHIFVPVGGGGLFSGVSRVAKNFDEKIKVIGVEPEDSNSMQQSLAAKKVVVLDHVGIFADGVAVKEVGHKTFKILNELGSKVITVNNDEMCSGIKKIFEDTRTVCEPAGALAVAGAIKYFQDPKTHDENTKIVCVNSGANMAFEKLQFIAERTLIGEKTESLFAITLPERPGALKSLYKNVIHGFSISEFSYRLASRDEANIFIGILTGDLENKQKIIDRLEKNGFEYEDLSTDEFAKDHVRFMIGGKPGLGDKECIYSFNFPERPGALRDFLQAIHNLFNISLFHYRGQGGDTGRVLIGFEADDVAQLETALDSAGYEYKKVESKAIDKFL